MYTLGEAARTLGKAKSTLSRDIKIGKLSAKRQDDGSLLIDPAELARVYRSNGSNTHLRNDPVPVEQQLFERLLSEKDVRIAAQDARIAELQADKEDLRRRLDQATALLTDQRGSGPRRPWWRRWRKP